MRSAPCSTRCVPPFALASISWYIPVGVAFAVGLLLFGIGTAILRSVREEEQGVYVTWPRLVDDALANADRGLRLDMIERLSLIGSNWSRDVLARAKAEERDPAILSAIESALAVMASCESTSP
jgi:hypothetical protein